MSSAVATTPGPGPDLESPGYGVRPEFDAEFAYHFGIPKPIIAAVNGPAAGVGFALACYCDLRFAAAGAKLTTAHGRLGLPAEFGLSWLLPRLVGLTRAADCCCRAGWCSPRRRLPSGSSTRSHRPPPSWTAWASTPTCWRRRSRRRRWPPPSSSSTPTCIATAATAARDADERLRTMMTGPDFAEGVAALTARRPPHFADPAGSTAVRRTKLGRVVARGIDAADPGIALAARLTDPELYRTDPHPLYARLRAEAPVAWNEELGFWAIAKHADVSAIESRPCHVLCRTRHPRRGDRDDVRDPTDDDARRSPRAHPLPATRATGLQALGRAHPRALRAGPHRRPGGAHRERRGAPMSCPC